MLIEAIYQGEFLSQLVDEHHRPDDRQRYQSEHPRISRPLLYERTILRGRLDKVQEPRGHAPRSIPRQGGPRRARAGDQRLRGGLAVLLSAHERVLARQPRVQRRRRPSLRAPPPRHDVFAHARSARLRARRPCFWTQLSRSSRTSGAASFYPGKSGEQPWRIWAELSYE